MKRRWTKRKQNCGAMGEGESSKREGLLLNDNTGFNERSCVIIRKCQTMLTIPVIFEEDIMRFNSVIFSDKLAFQVLI